MLRIALRRPPAMARQLRIITIEAAVVLDLSASKGTNAPDIQPLPINAARESLEGSFRQPTDVPIIVIRILNGLNQVQLCTACAHGYFRGTDAQPLQSLIRPRHKEKVPRPGHDRARTGEEHVGKGIAHGTDAQLVTRVVFSEKIDDIEHLSTLTLRVV